MEVIRKATEWALPGRACPCCAAVTFADPPPGAHAGSVCYGPVLNAAAVVLTAYGNVPPQRAAQVMAMLVGVPVSPGWIDKASARLAARLGKAGFDAAMLAALAGEKVLAADETPVNVLDSSALQPAAQDGDEQDPEEKEPPAPGAPHVLIVRTPDGRLTWLQALASRRKGDVAAGILWGSITRSRLGGLLGCRSSPGDPLGRLHAGPELLLEPSAQLDHRVRDLLQGWWRGVGRREVPP